MARKRERSPLKTLLGAVSLLTSAAAVGVIISSAFVDVLRVSGGSMSPALRDNELILCRKDGSFRRGDIVTFRLGGMIFVKRVIGIAGDTLDIDGAGNVYVNGVMAHEPYVGKKARGDCDIPLPCKVPRGGIFVMGDSREVSRDSRHSEIGCVPRECVIGRVVLRISPPKRAGRIGQNADADFSRRCAASLGYC